MDIDSETNNPIFGRIAVWALTSQGKQVGETLLQQVPQARLFISFRLAAHSPEAAGSVSDPLSDTYIVPARTKSNVFHRLSDAVAARFHSYDCHVFLFSTGIAVRTIAPLLVSKQTDPAVVVIDDTGQHAISLVSGHLGHANLYARQIARLLGATPVITTATDVNHLPSVDLLADGQNLFIETPGAIKTINMAFLENRKIGVHDPLNRITPLIPGQWIDNVSTGLPRVVCDWQTTRVSRETLVLRPRVLVVGIGCNRHTPFDTIFEFYTTVLADAGISPHSVCTLATSDIKKDEPGILALSESLNIPIQFYDNPQLSSVTSIQNPSKMVEKHIGVYSVCEAAAILASNNGTLVLPKQKNPDVTLAVALTANDSMS